MKKDKKFIIGIILLAIGVIGFIGVPSSDNKASLIAGSLIVLAIGGFLLYLSLKKKKETEQTSQSKTMVQSFSKSTNGTIVDGNKSVDMLPLIQNDYVKVYEYTNALCVIKEAENPLSYIQEKVNSGKRQISFALEPENPHDPLSIAIYLDDKKIGYVYRSQTRDMIHDYYKKNYEVCAHINTFTDEKITYKIGFYKPKTECKQYVVSLKNKKFVENVVAGEVVGVYYDTVDERYKIMLIDDEITLPVSVEEYGRENYEIPAEVGENGESLIFYK